MQWVECQMRDNRAVVARQPGQDEVGRIVTIEVAASVTRIARRDCG